MTYYSYKNINRLQNQEFLFCFHWSLALVVRRCSGSLSGAALEKELHTSDNYCARSEVLSLIVIFRLAPFSSERRFSS
jgi:hypothetical protein